MLKLLVSLSLMLSSIAFAAGNDPDHILKRPGDLQWMAGPEGLPKGAEVAVLMGDPSVAGEFVIRLKFPDKYKIPPHYHPQDENVTVISGEIALGMGHDTSINVEALPAASFAHMKAGTHHFAYANGETIVQINAKGPFGITYVNPNDDPRNP